MLFNELGLRAELLEAVAAKGYTEPSQIQAKSIPSILAGRDILGGAQTGTGKTAAFTLPLLQLLSERRPTADDSRQQGRRRRHLPRALVITPTRELAAQIGESVLDYGKGLQLSSTVIFGGVGINPQISRLRRGVDVLVATPGRLLDHVNQGTLDLSGIEILVLDEADRMLDMGFIHDIRKILKILPARRQNLLFSATYSDEIKKLSEGILHDPVLVEVARHNTAAEKVEQVIHPVAKNDKRHLLAQLINDNDWQQVLVFNRTKHGSNRLAKQLVEGGISATAIHGNKSQGARTKALADFKSGKVRVLVATDVASRGIDINRLPHVVNFDLPNVPEDYVHRIGRTGRAGEEGAAHSLVSADERGLLRDIERLLKRSIPVKNIEGYEMNEVDVKEAAEKKRSGRGGGGGGGRRSGGGGFSGRGRGGGGGGGRSSGSGNRRNSSRRRSSGNRSAA
ncbi:MAG: DEAD/DEAH box helicase [Verrucomicrobiota bacterium]